MFQDDDDDYEDDDDDEDEFEVEEEEMGPLTDAMMKVKFKELHRAIKKCEKISFIFAEGKPSLLILQTDPSFGFEI